MISRYLFQFVKYKAWNKKITPYRILRITFYNAVSNVRTWHGCLQKRLLIKFDGIPTTLILNTCPAINPNAV